MTWDEAFNQAYGPMIAKKSGVKPMNEIRQHIADAYVHQTEFTLQRHKLDEVCQLIPEYAALSLIRHCYSCNYNESVAILKLIRQRSGS